MHDFAQMYEDGRKAIETGQTFVEQPLHEGGRWGASAILRPTGEVLDRLAELAASAGVAAGPGQWVHDRRVLHFTLRALERYRSVISADDPRRLVYAECLRAAVAGLSPIEIDLVGIVPHPGGVLVAGRPVGDTIVTLQQRLAQGLLERGVHDLEYETRDQLVRDRWYVSLVHFAAPVAKPRSLLRWCEERRGLVVGRATLSEVEIMHAVQTGQGVRLDPLETASLDTVVAG
ncbi:hypothetical protein [Nonomuraea sp. NPDC050310]|uniref:2'-5' RNA ligase family protein n=1 Tax=Nonomuraea sp. NPDC050310 TaxID=3154935 RepID=UPI0033DD5284